MADASLIWDPDTGTADLAMGTNGDLVTGKDLETAVIISLFSDAQADPGDTVPDTADRRGWWADTYSALEDPALPAIANDRFGSKIWQVFARIRNQETLNWLANQVEVALHWMIVDGVASAVSATGYFTSSGGVGARVTIVSSGVPTIYDFAWAQEH